MKERKKLSEIKINRNKKYLKMENAKLRNSIAYENFKRPAYEVTSKEINRKE